MLKIKILLLLILIINSYKIKSQIFSSSQAHYNIKWAQINEPDFQLIFPEPYQKQAYILAHQIQEFINKNTADVNRKPRKITLLLQLNHVEQNGFVQLAPRKSEFYGVPSGIADNQQWLPNLALHELRHVVQFDNLTGKIKGPFGEQIALALFGINLPAWFFEGDAVLQETKLSTGGRGRLSSWNMPIRANILSNLNFNFNKYVHGSFKDIVPSYYTIGYFMTSLAHEKDPNIQAKILEDMNGKLLRPFNFQKSLKKYYGSKSSILFKNTIDSLRNIWANSDSTNLPNPVEFNDKFPTNYYLPQRANNRTYSLKLGPQNTAQIIEFNETFSTQKVIKNIGLQLMPYYHIRENLLVWDEYRKHIRFEKETKNVIHILDLKTKKQHTFKTKNKPYTPTLSPSLEEIAYVEIDHQNRSSLAFLNSTTGQKTDSILIPNNWHIQQPQYNEAGNELICIAISEQGTNLILVDRYKKSIQALYPWSNLQYERPIFSDQDIIFKANTTNKDNIFIYSNKKTYQITESKFGAFNPSIHQDTLWFNDYTAKGYQINKIELNKSNFKPYTLNRAQTLYNKQNNAEQPLTRLDSTAFAVKPYKHMNNLINFHSLSLSSNNFESLDNFKPGIFWISNDILNTTHIKLGAEYDNERQKSVYSAEINYHRYFPKFNITYKNRGQMSYAKLQSNNPNIKDTLIKYDWQENLITADIQIPLSELKENNVYAYGFNFGTYYLNRYNVSLKNLQNFINEVQFPLNYQIYFNKNQRRSTMDIVPRWGQNISFTFRHRPFDHSNQNIAWALRSSFYFPGILINHGINARIAIQNNKGTFQNINDIPLVAGFAYLPITTVKNTLLLDYKLPLFYPDWSIGQLAYIKRIRGTFSTDFMNIETTKKPQSLSAALDLDFNIFKYPLPNLTTTFKITHLNNISAKQKEKTISTFSISYSY